jgi:hypothetical protein
MHYFAYGSNMSTARLRQRVPSAMKVGLVSLAGHDLRFHKRGADGSGKCDACETGEQQDFVLGSLFLIEASDRIYLDRAEGLGRGYDEKWVTVTDHAGAGVRALTYCATAIDESLKPYSWYLNHVIIGARETGLPDHYLARIEGIVSVEDTDLRRDAMERAVHVASGIRGQFT